MIEKMEDEKEIEIEKEEEKKEEEEDMNWENGYENEWLVIDER